jgi:phenylacetate-coenzyme A ligase PaaK-like adenylate-forming protein
MNDRDPAATFRELLSLDDATSEAVADIQARKLRALVSCVRRDVPFYRDLELSANVELGDLPLVDKAMLMTNLSTMCAEPSLDVEEIRRGIPRDERDGPFRLYRDRYYVRRTSGTTGYFGFYLWDEEMSEVAESSATRFVPAPHELPKPVVAVSPVVVWHPLQAVFERLHTVPLSAGLSGTVERLHALRPRTIMGSPGFVSELAEEHISGRLRIAPKVVAVGSEQCTPLQRERMRAAWGVEPLEQYGLSEAGLIASRCDAGRFHVHEDTVILELLDDRDRPVAAGRRCNRALLTRLLGPVQPIIRYELDDLIVAGPERCDCGWPFRTLERIEGRTKSRLWLRSESGGVVGLSAYTLIPALETTPGVLRYQIRYEHPDTIDVLLLRRGPIDEAELIGQLTQQLRAHGAVPPAVRIRRGDPPSIWRAPHGSKEHHLCLTVTRDQVAAEAA